MRKKYLHNGSKIPTNVVNKVNYYVKVDMPHLSFERALIDLMDKKEVILDSGKWSIIKRDRVRKAPYMTRKKKETAPEAIVTGSYPVRHVTKDVFLTTQLFDPSRFVSHHKNYEIYQVASSTPEMTDDESQDFSEDSPD